MADILSLDMEDFKKTPERWIKLAVQLANKEEQIIDSFLQEIEALEVPEIVKARPVRKCFWELLALDSRDIGLRWLDKVGILDTIIPCWTGNSIRRKLRLNSIEQISVAKWKDGLDEKVLKTINDVHEVVVDRRLNRWALTALSTLLAGGDTENQNSWAKIVRRDLHEFGATEAELVWIERIVREFNAAILFLMGETTDYVLRPELAVSVLSTIKVSDPKQFKSAVEIANKALLESISPLDSDK